MKIDLKREEQILRILGLIEKYWVENPEENLYMTLANLNLLDEDAGLWAISDDITEKNLKEVIEESEEE